jgi:hypothetical protein
MASCFHVSRTVTRRLSNRRETLQTILRAAISLLLTASAPIFMLGAQTKGEQTISASVVQDNVQTGTAAVKGPATVTCIGATNGGGGPNSRPATCYITGPGYHGDVSLGQSIGTSGAGTVTLGCDGSPEPLHCTARVKE